MGTKKITLTKEQGYVKISAGEDKGSVMFISGGVALFRQDSVQPVIDDVHMGIMDDRKPEFLYGGLGTEGLYAKARDKDVVISVTPWVEG